MKFPDWTSEPLVHFLVVGFALFAGLTWSGGGSVDPASRVIAVDREQQAQIALQFERTMGRAPTDAELDSAIDRFIRDEVLYREALRLGLDQGDGVVRRRLVTKMDLSASAAAEAAVPDEASLRAYYEKNADRYSGEAKVSFAQAWFETEAEAKAALSGEVRGGSISLPGVVGGKPMREVEIQFGEQFARGLATLKLGEDWQGPIPSGFGWHLSRLRNRSVDAVEFEDVRAKVENDWRSAEIAARKERAFAVLRDAYRVEIAR